MNLATALLGAVRLRGGGGDLHGLRGDLGLVRPPGSADENDFLSLCVRCTRCAEA